MTVTFAVTTGEVNYCVTMDRNWDIYAGKYKGWAANEDHHLLSVPADWRRRVFARGLATAGGMMTLYAHALEPLQTRSVAARTLFSHSNNSIQGTMLFPR
jgi:hypothetical protein